MRGRGSKGRGAKIAGTIIGLVVGFGAVGFGIWFYKSGGFSGEGGFGRAPAEPVVQVAPEEVLQNTKQQYASISSYSSEGVVTMNLDVSAMMSAMGPEVAAMPGVQEAMGQPQTITYSFSVKLSRPNYYSVAWEQSMMGGGGVWTTDEGTFLLPDRRRYHRMQNAHFALGIAAGHSVGAAQTIPVAFLGMDHGMLKNVFEEFIPAATEPDDAIDGEECHVISGTLLGGAATLWIRKSDSLMKQISYELTSEMMDPQISDEDVRQILVEMRRQPTPQAMAAVRKRLQSQMAFAAKFQQSIQGSIVETHNNIETDGHLSPEDFKQEPPPGARLMPFSL
jgi:hypothetical protein